MIASKAGIATSTLATKASACKGLQADAIGVLLDWLNFSL
jgi:hypothetical protein